MKAGDQVPTHRIKGDFRIVECGNPNCNIKYHIQCLKCYFTVWQGGEKQHDFRTQE